MIARAGRALLTCALLTGCAAEVAPPPSGPRTCESLAPVQAGLLQTLVFERQMGGISRGFDLDGIYGPPPGNPGCRGRDYDSPDGATGIDNQLSTLIPALEAQVGEGTLDTLIQDSINNGQMALALVVEGLDDYRDDDCVAVSVQRLRGVPLVGADRRLLPGQTLEIDPDAPVSRYEGAVLRDGVIEAGPFDIALPVSILDAVFVLDLHEARVRIRLAEDGSMAGEIAGGLALSQITEIAAGLNIPSDLMEMVALLGTLIADLHPVEGDCTRFSATVTYTATYGFVVGG